MNSDQSFEMSSRESECVEGVEVHIKDNYMHVSTKNEFQHSLFLFHVGSETVFHTDHNPVFPVSSVTSKNIVSIHSNVFIRDFKEEPCFRENKDI